MRLLRYGLPCGLLLLGFLFWPSTRSTSPSRVAKEPAHSPPRRPVASSPAASATSADETKLSRRQALRRFGYAQDWDGDLPPALADFRAWVARYRSALPATRRDMEPEGAALAAARRSVMRELIIANPERALAVTVPAVARQDLPAPVVAELETRVSGEGELLWVESTPQSGQPAQPGRRLASIRGTQYIAHAYGRRATQLYVPSASLHGITLDGHLAVHASPVRLLEPGEISAGAAADRCPVSNLPVEGLTAGAAVNLDEAGVVEARGRLWEFCHGTTEMLEAFAGQLEALEGTSNLQTLSTGTSDGLPTTAAEAATAWTTGKKQVLVIRIDFSDLPGEPVSQQAALDTMNNNVKPWFTEVSYGVSTVEPTVSSAVYRMPQTASSYAQSGNVTQLHTDARNAASADYTIANYDRIVVVFANLGATRFPSSKITFGGEGLVGGPNVWINGTFNLRVLAHELGHTYGLKHANFWQVADNNPVSPIGVNIEYGDPYDAMGDQGDTSSANISHHYSPWQKNRLGWLADSAVLDVKTGGTYRVYRYDTAQPAQQPLALRLFRDGVRSYWIGYRQKFTSNAALTNGAYITWGYNNRQQSVLLDMETPGASSQDSALAVGDTFTDPAYGITIKTLARGGAEPNQYLDVQITMPDAVPNVIAAWGHDNGFFTDTPNIETNVPMGTTGIQSIALGDGHGLALKSDGTVIAWGDNTSGQTNVPPGLGDVVSVVAGGNVSGVVLRDGTVRLWGESVGGLTTPPANLSGVKQLAIGGSHSVQIYHALALKNDGTVVGWGDNSRNQITIPSGLNSVVAITASDRVSHALKADGTVVRWGTSFSSSIAFPSGLSGVKAIAASGASQFALALKNDGTVVGWGVNNYKQAEPPAGLSNVVAIATGSFHALALKADGTVVAWGYTGNDAASVPGGLPRAFAIAGGDRASLALVGPHVYLTGQPQPLVATAGGAATFSVDALGGGALSYQWRKDGVAITGATSRTFTITSATTGDAGSYDVIVRDSTSTLTSLAARLTVTAVAPPPSPTPNGPTSRLANLSILTSLGAANDTFTLGHVVGGAGTSGSKTILIRVAGPTLGAAPFNIQGVLTDPKLETFVGSTKSGENDNWGGTSALKAAFTAVGAFPYISDSSLDAAVLATLSAGDNSVRVSGTGPGTVIAELYDSTPFASLTATSPRLVNVSVLKQIGSLLTVGFVIDGTSSKKVLIRAVGPTLGSAPFNVQGVVADPQMTLFSGQTPIGTNNDWGGTAELTAAFNQVGAFALPAASKDAALLVTLQPGAYTVQVTGVGGTTGVSLVEVYEMP